MNDQFKKNFRPVSDRQIHAIQKLLKKGGAPPKN